MNEHLKSIGFKSVLGDPYLFRKELADGRKIFVCTYIDDVMYGVSGPEIAGTFLSDLRKLSSLIKVKANPRSGFLV